METSDVAMMIVTKMAVGSAVVRSSHIIKLFSDVCSTFSAVVGRVLAVVSSNFMVVSSFSVRLISPGLDCVTGMDTVLWLLGTLVSSAAFRSSTPGPRASEKTRVMKRKYILFHHSSTLKTSLFSCVFFLNDGFRYAP